MPMDGIGHERDRLAHSETGSRPLLGVALIVMAGFAATGQDVSAKLLNRSISPIEIGWLRYAFQCGLIGLWSIGLRSAGRRQPVLATPLTPIQVARAIAMVVSGLAFIWGTRILPLPMATAIAFTAPAMITFLGAFFLRERISAVGWAALGLGLIGVIVIVRPGGGFFSWASLLPALSALGWAVGALLARRMGGGHDPRTTLLYNAAIGLALMTVSLPFGWRMPTVETLWLFLPLGLSSFGLQILGLYAYRVADISFVAPFSYCQLIWSTLAGIAVFGNLPDAATLIGMAVIAAAGIVAGLNRPRPPRTGQLSGA